MGSCTSTQRLVGKRLQGRNEHATAGFDAAVRLKVLREYTSELARRVSVAQRLCRSPVGRHTRPGGACEACEWLAFFLPGLEIRRCGLNAVC